MRRERFVVSGVGVVAIGVIMGYVIGRARAAGIPSMPPVMTYSGTLTDATGAPLTGAKNIQVQIWNLASGGTTPVCVTASSSQTLLGGSFQIALPDTCTSAVHAAGDLWAEVLADGASLGRTKIGAVPYAVEAGAAASASGALDTRLNTLMPPKSVVSAYLTASDVTSNFDSTGLGNSSGAYAGWAVCNGNNGTPDLSGRFVRVNNTASGATGGSDSMAHTHAIDHDHPAFTSGAEAAHTHATPAHQHLLPIGFDGSDIYWTGDGSSLPLYGSTVVSANRSAIAEGTSGSGLTRQAYTDNSGAGTTGAGSAHSHTVDPPAFTGTSGPASMTDNRPAYYELVALMRM